MLIPYLSPLTFHDPSLSHLPAAHSVGDDGAVGVFVTCKPAKDALKSPGPRPTAQTVCVPKAANQQQIRSSPCSNALERLMERQLNVPDSEDSSWKWTITNSKISELREQKPNWKAGNRSGKPSPALLVSAIARSGPRRLLPHRSRRCLPSIQTKNTAIQTKFNQDCLNQGWFLHDFRHQHQRRFPLRAQETCPFSRLFISVINPGDFRDGYYSL